VERISPKLPSLIRSAIIGWSIMSCGSGLLRMNEKQLTAFLAELIALPGLSGFEDSIRNRIRREWEPRAARLDVSRTGSLHAMQSGTGTGKRPKILLAAHMDAIGLMITEVVDGFCRVTEVGGVDARILPGLSVNIHGRADIPATIVLPPAALLPPDRTAEAARLQDLWLDTGLSASEARRLIRTGDIASFAQPPVELADGLLCGKSLDNRAGVAALTACLDELRARPHRADVIAAATVQEEETLGGAYTSAFAARPDLAVAVDVTWARGANLPEHKTFSLGEGPTLGWGPNIHPALFRSLEQAAHRLDIPFHFEAIPQHSGTDAFAMQVTAEGIPTAVIGIPLRYMHTPVEVVAPRDVLRAGRLLAEWIFSIDDAFLANLSWE
jgi:tetrahedral aminopeptidase